MSSNLFLRVGDYAVTNKGLPGIKAGTDVQIAGVGIKDGKLQYSAALITPDDKILGLIGPYPAHAFTFVCACDTKALHALIKYVSAQQSTGDARQKIRESETEHDERAADEMVRDIGAVPEKKSSARKATRIAQEVVTRPETKYDNSHNWGHKGRVAQRTRDDLNDPKPDTEI